MCLSDSDPLVTCSASTLVSFCLLVLSDVVTCVSVAVQQRRRFIYFYSFNYFFNPLTDPGFEVFISSYLTKCFQAESSGLSAVLFSLLLPLLGLCPFRCELV